MAVLVLTYDNLTGKFFSQLIGADQLASASVLSGKVGSGQIGIDHIVSGYPGYRVASGYPAVGLTGAIPEPRISGLIVSGITLSGGLTLPGFTINEDQTARAGTVLASGAGVVDLVDGPIATSGFSSGIEVGYFYRLGGMPFLRVYAEPDGVGGLQNRRVELIQQAYTGSLPVPMVTSGGYITSAFISGGLVDGRIASGITAQKLLSGYFGYKVASGYPSEGLTGFVLPARISGLPYVNLNLLNSIVSGDIKSGQIGDPHIFPRLGLPKMPDGTSGYVLTGLGSGYNPTYASVPLPSGLIVMWSGTIASIPSGWVICDGLNNTPNLLAKFVEGVATAATDPGATGGATNKTTAGHTHTGPSHTHARAGGGYVATTASFEGGDTGLAAYVAAVQATDPVGGAAGTGNTGSKTDSIADIRPLFYDIAFIMKT